jgi:hypothetical protein
MSQVRASLGERAQRLGFTWMLVLLIVFSVLSAYGQSAELEHIPLRNAALGLALVLGVYAAEVSRPYRVTAIVLVVIALVWQRIGEGSASGAVREGHFAPFAVLTIYTLVVTFRHVFRAERITMDKIAGTICVYALIAALFGIFYNLIGADAFDFARELERPEAELFYFSWVTLSTLGYGDVTPVAPLARVAASIECISGQFYIAIVVARLVALQLMQSRD